MSRQRYTKEVEALIAAAEALLMDAIDRGDCFANEDEDGYEPGQMYADYQALDDALVALGCIAASTPEEMAARVADPRPRIAP